jgi:hypothetical protein
MTQDAERCVFRGVKCYHCNEPIPISQFVASMAAEPEGDESGTPKHHECQAFTLRCAVCVKEWQYVIAEILEFVGVPKTVHPRVKPPLQQAREFGNNSRAANA